MFLDKPEVAIYTSIDLKFTGYLQIINYLRYQGGSVYYKAACIRGGWVFLRQSCCIVPVYYMVGVPRKFRMLYSTCVLYGGCSEKIQNSVQYLCTIWWVFQENLECCIVPVYSIACVWVENQECFVIPVNKSAVYYFVFYNRSSGGKSKYL